MDDAGAADAESAESAIRAAGLRVTSARLAVLDALREHPHASADAIFADVDRRAPGTTLQSVYNALGDFAGAGLVRRIQPAGQPMRFEVRIDDNHHHLVCTSCGRVEDVDCVTGEAPCLHPSQMHGFTLSQAEITFWGRCASCSASDVDPSSPTENPTVMEGRS
ncbi:MAG TPA: transcriptional repressor [Microbacterium sp.]|jgi:Fur family ferric uptake transcriptional regulator|uniref:Fur family transcriptional regulator n=1 Tax=unclassified Microbacterium TaxID=2609290 RepID=UPI000C58474D|nr:MULTISPECIES: Fur family transcriptional regulator [unclassified Microbacterium]MBU19655.1 transcriptional repressor [Microbacterium sp.]HBS08549.1 transcriptional repressor [Microbacterium sp.]HBU42413.1 transcriptional repressor [Microbacterium sp.]HCM49639.1 transcriptional repressor [Microbacterium sp.]|tara:strand:- start:82 stop:573 length:492 start_codon:yes stop_codon:yes gene_type:complete